MADRRRRDRAVPGRIRRVPDRAIERHTPRHASRHPADGAQRRSPELLRPKDYRFIPDHPIEDVGSTIFETELQPDGTATLVGSPPAGSRVVVDVPDSPFVKVGGGATRAGSTADGLLVIDVESPSDVIILTSTTPWPAIIGRWVTAAWPHCRNRTACFWTAVESPFRRMSRPRSPGSVACHICDDLGSERTDRNDADPVLADVPVAGSRDDG